MALVPMLKVLMSLPVWKKDDKDSKPEPPKPILDCLSLLHGVLPLLPFSLANEVAHLCEQWFKRGYPDNIALTTNTVKFLLRKALSPKGMVSCFSKAWLAWSISHQVICSRKLIWNEYGIYIKFFWSNVLWTKNQENSNNYFWTPWSHLCFWHHPMESSSSSFSSPSTPTWFQLYTRPSRQYCLVLMSKLLQHLAKFTTRYVQCIQNVNDGRWYFRPMCRLGVKVLVDFWRWSKKIAFVIWWRQPCSQIDRWSKDSMFSSQSLPSWTPSIESEMTGFCKEPFANYGSQSCSEISMLPILWSGAMLLSYFSAPFLLKIRSGVSLKRVTIKNLSIK